HDRGEPAGHRHHRGPVLAAPPDKTPPHHQGERMHPRLNDYPVRPQDITGGSLYNSLATIGPDGGTLNLHRKLSPTHTERIVWAAGDGAGLRVVDTPAGRIGSLVRWEHFNPLARHALHAQHEVIHVAVWPDMPESHRIAARSYALEGRCFVISAGQVLSTDDIPADLLDAYRAGVGPDAPESGLLFDGGSSIAGPDGSWIVAPVFGEARIITATLETGERYEELMDLDVAGRYARPDIFQLSIDRARRDSGVSFTD
ncbi:MAG: hypothetical protein EOP24_44590, partial [Hyphomicrobiales bacterium]